MFKQSQARDRLITREIHKLYYRSHVIKKWRLYSVVLLRLLAFSLQSTFIPLVVAYGLQAIIEKDLSKVYFYVWLIVAMSVAYALLLVVIGRLITWVAVEGNKYVQRKVFANFLSKDHEFYSNTFFGSLAAQAIRLREMSPEWGKIFTLDIPKHAIAIVPPIIIIGINSWQLAAATLLCMLLVLAFTVGTSSYRLKYRRMLSESSSELSGVISDGLSHAVTVKAFAAENHELSRLESTLGKWGSDQTKSWHLVGPSDGGRALLASITTIVLLLMTAKLYVDGTITFAVVALVQLYSVRLIATTQDIAESIKTYEMAMGSAYQPMVTMLEETQVNDPAKSKRIKDKDNITLAFDNVGFSYEQNEGKNVISNFTMQIKPGEKVGIVGYSGSGKTTLTKLLMRFMDVRQGCIKINGNDIRDVSQSDLRRLIAYVPQEPLLFHRSLVENIAYGRPDATRAQIEQAAKLAHVHEFVGRLPHGYDTLVGERGVKLSGGQRQRVAIARAILLKAPVLVLDEATSSLDSKSEVYIQKALWRLMKGKTAVVVAHRLSTIQHMDRIVVMDRGKIIAVGTHDELLREKGIYAELWAHQSGGYIGVPQAAQS